MAQTNMRKLAVTQNITVDGSIEMLDDWFDPQGQAQIDNSDLLEEMHRQDAQSDAFLVGRQTFDDLRGYWPTLSQDPTGIADYLNAVAKYVVSNTLVDPQWQHTTVLSGDPATQVQALKDSPGRDIVLTGSITLCHALIDAGLVDEYRLFVYPVVQGRGRGLFPDGYRVPRLRLLDAKAFRGGVTYSCYAPA
jgi:dihydrofolate reductase